MTFIEALPAAFEGGERIRRSSWPVGVYCVVHNKQFCINWDSSVTGQVSNQWHPLILEEDDYFSEDWEVGE